MLKKSIRQLTLQVVPETARDDICRYVFELLEFKNILSQRSKTMFELLELKTLTKHLSLQAVKVAWVKHKVKQHMTQTVMIVMGAENLVRNIYTENIFLIFPKFKAKLLEVVLLAQTMALKDPVFKNLGEPLILTTPISKVEAGSLNRTLLVMEGKVQVVLRNLLTYKWRRYWARNYGNGGPRTGGNIGTLPQNPATGEQFDTYRPGSNTGPFGSPTSTGDGTRPIGNGITSGNVGIQRPGESGVGMGSPDMRPSSFGTRQPSSGGVGFDGNVMTPNGFNTHLPNGNGLGLGGNGMAPSSFGTQKPVALPNIGISNYDSPQTGRERTGSIPQTNTGIVANPETSYQQPNGGQNVPNAPKSPERIWNTNGPNANSDQNSVNRPRNYNTQDNSNGPWNGQNHNIGQDSYLPTNIPNSQNSNVPWTTNGHASNGVQNGNNIGQNLPVNPNNNVANTPDSRLSDNNWNMPNGNINNNNPNGGYVTGQSKPSIGGRPSYNTDPINGGSFSGGGDGGQTINREFNINRNGGPGNGGFNYNGSQGGQGNGMPEQNSGHGVPPLNVIDPNSISTTLENGDSQASLVLIKDLMVPLLKLLQMEVLATEELKPQSKVNIRVAVHPVRKPNKWMKAKVLKVKLVEESMVPLVQLLGGMADAQAKGPGSTSSQAQIGFTPYKEGDEDHKNQKTPFAGGGKSLAQSNGRLGQSESQLHGTFKYGITYTGGAQAGSSVDKDAVFSKRLPFNEIDVFDESEKNIEVESETSTEQTSSTEPSLTTDINTYNANGESQNGNMNQSNLTHTEDHKTETLQPTGDRRSFEGVHDDGVEYEDTTIKGETVAEDYDSGAGYGEEGTEVDEEYTTYTLGPLRQNEITQTNSEQKPDESKIYQPGERVPGTGGYTIPIGFTGSVKSVASKQKTYAIGSKDSPSQAQTVAITPGAGRIKYNNHAKPRNTYTRNVHPKDLRSLYSPRQEDNRYVTVSKSVTGALDGDNNIKKQYSHTYYTKSSSCGYFTFTCTIVSGTNGRTKICKPKIPLNPDGTPMKC
ncbi:hypothetical protein EVAR_63902_1 [Eumeta japonica]|uniref:Uncharacterized protein n=1 Tax=Eumeta variegata TaxID=151549 RepID=A0A4C1ZME8_EUMVA|nr:hypothetical protein EVAR_63902_1 [Eumeta japonica]